MTLNPLELIGSGVSKLAEAIFGGIDSISTTEEEKLAAKARMAKVITAYEKDLMDYVRGIEEAQRDVIVAELKQDDKYTKRARPTVVYVGLAAFIFNYVLIPNLGQVLALLGLGAASVTLVPIAFPTAFWVAWGGVTGTWAIGRSAEKVAKVRGEEPSALTKLITG